MLYLILKAPNSERWFMNQGIREDLVLALLFEYLHLFWLRLQHYPEPVPSDLHHLFSAFLRLHWASLEKKLDLLL